MMCAMAADDRKDTGTPPGGGVISNLPRHRPHHRSGKRAARPPENGRGHRGRGGAGGADVRRGRGGARDKPNRVQQRKPRAAGGKRGAARASSGAKTDAGGPLLAARAHRRDGRRQDALAGRIPAAGPRTPREARRTPERRGGRRHGHPRRGRARRDRAQPLGRGRQERAEAAAAPLGNTDRPRPAVGRVPILPRFAEPPSAQRTVGGGPKCGPEVRRGESAPLRVVAPEREPDS